MARQAAAILVYHRVTTLARDPFGLAISPDCFDSQARVLAERFPTVPLEAIGETPGAVAVTFDDGYDDVAAPAQLLASRGVPATYFICSGLLGEVPWWERLAAARGGEALAVEHARLLRLGAEAQAEAVAGLAVPADARLLDAAGVRALAEREGGTVGAHSAHHLWLPSQPDGVRARELAEDKARLEALVGRAVTAFAYPFGARDEATEAQVRAAGFRVAVTTEARAVRHGAAPLAMPRLAAPALAGDAFGDWLDQMLAA